MSLQPKRAALKALCAAKNAVFVGNRGPCGAPLVAIGEAPGADEDTSGSPFVGVSGRLLDQMLSEAGFATNEVWFTNVYKTRPPDNDLDRFDEVGIPATAFHEELLEELYLHKPTFILACGATPLSFLCPQTVSSKTDKAGISHWRGSLLESPLLTWPHYVFPIYHPAFLLREWSEKYFNTFLLCKLKAELEFFRKNGRLQSLPERELIVEPSFAEAYEYLSDILACSNDASAPTSVDIELLRRRIIYCVSFAKHSNSAISIGFGDYDIDSSTRLFRLMDRILSTNSVVGQNYINFDAHWFRHTGFNVNTNLVHDTRIRHNILWPELPHKLEVLTMQYTREPYYKEEGRSWNRVAGSGKRQLMRYNCKDTCVTREAYDVQELEFADNPGLRTVYDSDIDLARKLHYVAYRGLKVDQIELKQLENDITSKLAETCTRIEGLINAPAVFSSAEQKRKPNSINIASPAQLVKLLLARGLKVPKDRFSGNYTTGEAKLHTLFAESGDVLLNEVLTVRELNKIEATTVKAVLVNDTFYSDYVVGGTGTGRRSSREFPVHLIGQRESGFGGNGQNIAKHSKLGKQFRRALKARSGKIFLSCDQMSAEDWIVQGIIADQSGDMSGINDLRSGVDRHCKLAMFVCGMPEDKCNKAAEKSGLIFRYIGKRTRHGGNYDMHGNTMSGVMAKEGYSVPAANCEQLLNRFHLAEPNIKGVFHEYVQRTITNTRHLDNLFGRGRDFFGFCPWRDNSEVFRVGYAYIPQGTVGDNTGRAIRYCEQRSFGCVVSESHDSIILEIDDNVDSIFHGVQLLTNAFNNKLIFPKGFELVIPIEFELGYNITDTVGLGDQILKCANLSKAGLLNTWRTLRQQVKHQVSISTGVPLVQ